MNALYISSFCQRLPLESSLFKRYEAIFNVALKLVIHEIALVCSVIGSENSFHFFNQLDTKQKTLTT